MLIDGYKVPDEIGTLIKKIRAEITEENAVYLDFETYKGEVQVNIDGLMSKRELERIIEIINLIEKHKTSLNENSNKT